MNLVSKLYLLLVFGVIYAPDFGAIDMKASQWLFLSSINLVYLIIITLKIKKNQFQLVYKNPIFLSFLFFDLLLSSSSKQRTFLSESKQEPASKA